MLAVHSDNERKLAVSSVPANARLGALVLVGLVAAFATTLLLLPSVAPGAERE